MLTDPVFSDHIAINKRYQPPGLAMGELPPLDAVIISHVHYDHFDVPTLLKLDSEVPVILPVRTKSLSRRFKKRPVIELERWQAWEKDSLRITAVPARHFSGRYLLDGLFRISNGYVVEYNNLAVYFAGDTAYSGVFKEIKDQFDLDVALLPIGAYRPSFIMRWNHMRPEQAVTAFKDTGADYLMPIHWGTFKLSWEPMGEPIEHLNKITSQLGISDRVIVRYPGESWRLVKEYR